MNSFIGGASVVITGFPAARDSRIGIPIVSHLLGRTTTSHL